MNNKVLSIELEWLSSHPNKNRTPEKKVQNHFDSIPYFKMFSNVSKSKER